ncbi:FtsX-like permease family protein [Opitutus sp. ER46]|uniref:ABC transporter permease n=1 Tax=Opitutus sp. ER46 TaxID=2161864 RepID=UPI000D317877|nr:FtsX-like permease family protein [Opitutus sp. ER46]PTX92616.1 ABC transporter permease [Opitutus sp. ER46]
MSPNLRIAFRFLTAKKRSMLMSLSCTILGVGLFIVTQATTSGFEQFFIRTILGTDGAIRIEDKIQDTMRSMSAGGGSKFEIWQKDGVKYIEGVEDPDALTGAVRQFNDVRGVSAVVRGNVQVTGPIKTEDAQVFGIRLTDHLQVSDLDQQIIAGNLREIERGTGGAAIGRVIADRLQLSVGDSFVISARGESRRQRVVAIYETGVQDIDKLRIYVPLAEAKSLLKKATGASFLQISLRDPNRAPSVAAQMQDVLRYNVRPWQVREKTWLAVFRALRISSAITVTVFTLIAGLAMFNTLAMIVFEKTKDIAILRSMGYERRDITQIFLWQAGIVLTIGSIAGALFGAGVTWCVSQVPLPITGIFKTEHFIVTWELQHYVLAVLTAVVMVMVASMIPARRAARVEPGDIIRGTAQ